LPSRTTKLHEQEVCSCFRIQDSTFANTEIRTGFNIRYRKLATVSGFRSHILEFRNESWFRIPHSLKKLCEASGFANPKTSFSGHQQMQMRNNFPTSTIVCSSQFANHKTRNECRTGSVFAIASCNLCLMHPPNHEKRNECRTGSGFAISTFN
jgi:hypothetical protein